VRQRRIALYLRVSSEDQQERGTIENQRQYLLDRAKLDGWNVVDIYSDEGISGTVPFEQRSEGRRLLDDAEGCRFDEVIFYRLDRLGRRLRVILDAHDQLERLNVAVRSATEPIDTTSPMGRFIFQLLGMIAELEHATIKERTDLGRVRHCCDGKWLTGRLPYGYDTNEHGQLTPSLHPVLDKDGQPLEMTESELVEEMFTRAAEGEPQKAIVRWLNSIGASRTIRHPGGTTRVLSEVWRQSMVNRLLHSTVYRGFYEVAINGKPIKNTCPALVSENDYRRLCAVAQKNRSFSKSPIDRPYLLSGLVRCSCGSPYTGTSQGKANKRHYYYGCAGRRENGRCNAKLVPAELLEQYAFISCQQAICAPEVTLEASRKALAAQLALRSDILTQRTSMEKALSEVNNRRDNLTLLFETSRISLQAFDQREAALRDEEDALREQLANLRTQDELAALAEDRLASLAEMLQRLTPQAMDPQSFEERREVVSNLIGEVIISTEGEARRKQAMAEVRLSFPGLQSLEVSKSHSRDRKRTPHLPLIIQGPELLACK
jgi:site-specific DNA recombinase